MLKNPCELTACILGNASLTLAVLVTMAEECNIIAYNLIINK